jgi:hypothetical protein
MSRRARALTGTALLQLHERSADRALSREAARVVGARHAVPAATVVQDVLAFDIQVGVFTQTRYSAATFVGSSGHLCFG